MADIWFHPDTLKAMTDPGTFERGSALYVSQTMPAKKCWA